ncbi:hypothetical protein [Phytomonospora endophytica]|uniref:Uncharacterized protein n=1 Tax=Phytomonospora endophytica TaxID=714109 RepID=A0A841FAL7_9ACTN|nr:hypothetical protein [Phytomonospora endophytica]MBB6034301.1 hypothetical protein [Phytomonospora endophytica]GIG66695.1 hypothetical protein Pen01_29900 [Phytomonospora endophytica]
MLTRPTAVPATLTEEMAYGLMCVGCRRDVRDGRADEVAVGEDRGWTLVACRGACAAGVCGDPDGWADKPGGLPSLTDRIDRWEDDGDS